MSFTLYEDYAAQVTAREDKLQAHDPQRKRSPIACFIDDIRDGDYVRAAKRLMVSPIFHARVNDGKLVVTDRYGHALGHIEVPANIFPGLHGPRGWARECGKRLSEAEQ
jgi:hypothetical protein